MRSKLRWFTEFCNSHYVSHFAAFFIVTGAKTSFAESFLRFFGQWQPQRTQRREFAAGFAASEKCVHSDGARPQSGLVLHITKNKLV
jgi:hypothetical protein